MSSEVLARRTVKNIGFNAVAKAVMFSLQAVASIVLTRTLMPDDYGIVGMALIFMNFFVLFGDMGISNAVIRKECLTDREMYTGFTVRVIQGFLLVLFCVVASPVVSKIYSNPVVGMILAVFSLNFIINSFGFLPYVRLNRELRYDLLFIPQVGYAAIGSIVAIAMAVCGYKHWSLVFSTMSSSLAYVLLLNIIRPSRMHFCMDKNAAISFINYGMNIFLSGLVSYALMNIGNLLIGTVKGPVLLGYYSIANNWGWMICGIVMATISSVLFPTFAKIQNDRVLLKKAYLKVYEYASIIAIYANVTLLLTGKEFLYYILGNSTEKWFPALLAFQILCVCGILKSMIEPGSSLLMAIGDTSTQFKATLFPSIFQVVFAYHSIKYGGIEGVAVLTILSVIFQFIIYMYSVNKQLHIKSKDFFTRLMFLFFPAIVTVVFYIIFDHLVVTTGITSYIIKIIFITAVYFSVSLTVNRIDIVGDIKRFIS